MTDPVPLVVVPGDPTAFEGGPPVFPINGEVTGAELLQDDFIHDGATSARVLRDPEPPVAGRVAVLLTRNGVEWVADLPADARYQITRLVDSNLEH